MNGEFYDSDALRARARRARPRVQRPLRFRDRPSALASRRGPRWSTISTARSRSRSRTRTRARSSSRATASARSRFSGPAKTTRCSSPPRPGASRGRPGRRSAPARSSTCCGWATFPRPTTPFEGIQSVAARIRACSSRRATVLDRALVVPAARRGRRDRRSTAAGELVRARAARGGRAPAAAERPHGRPAERRARFGRRPAARERGGRLSAPRFHARLRRPLRGRNAVRARRRRRPREPAHRLSRSTPTPAPCSATSSRRPASCSRIPRSIAWSELCRRASEHAVVFLTGDGGDEALIGYRRHRAARIAAATPRIPARGRARRRPAPVRPFAGAARSRRFRRRLAAPLADLVGLTPWTTLASFLHPETLRPETRSLGSTMRSLPRTGTRRRRRAPRSPDLPSRRSDAEGRSRRDGVRSRDALAVPRRRVPRRGAQDSRARSGRRGRRESCLSARSCAAGSRTPSCAARSTASPSRSRSRCAQARSLRSRASS